MPPPRRSSRSWTPDEAGFQHMVIDMARHLGWRCVHFRAARTAHGWVTPVEGDGAGWVDLVLVRDRVIFAELKAGNGRLSAEQAVWLDALAAAGAETYVWRPADLDLIERVLRRRAAVDPGEDSS